MDTDFSALASMVQKLMDNPAVGDMLGGLMGSSQPEKTTERESASETTPVKEASKDAPKGEAKEAIAVSRLLPKQYDKARAEKLLYAIKPYLNPTRCSIIDKCVSVMQITDLMGALGGLEGMLDLGKPRKDGDS